MFAFIMSLPLKFAALPDQCKGDFFGIPTWYKYLPIEYSAKNGCTLPNDFKLLGNGYDSGLLLIGLALVDIALRIAAMVALGYVIYGGFSFMTSQGEPDAAARARQTIVNALIGLGLAMVATTIVVFTGNRLNG